MRAGAALLILLLGELPEDNLPRPLPLLAPAGLELAFERAGVVLEEGRLPLDPAWVDLGRALFFDPILSRDQNLSCASCHQPEHSFSDKRPLSLGQAGQTKVHAPALVNRILGQSFMWDGRARTLEEQVLMPLVSPIEMALPVDEALTRLTAASIWTARFEQVSQSPPSEAALARALASFVKALVQGDTPVDRFLLGDVAALDAAEEAGMWIYESRGKCWRCHSGKNFSDERFHATGIGLRDGELAPGRFAVTGELADMGRFKTPTLRGLGHSAPYMHDGSLATLEEVVEFYRRGGNLGPGLSPLLEPLELSDKDAANLVAFLRALTVRQ